MRNDHLLIFKQLDPIGLVLFSAGLALVLVPITIATSNPHGWKSAHIIAMIVVGFVLLLVFAFWEAKWSKRPIVSVVLMKNVTVVTGMIDQYTHCLFRITLK